MVDSGENEFGEVGIDDAIVLDAEEEIFEMNNGCLHSARRLIRSWQFNASKRPIRSDSDRDNRLADPAGPQTFFVDDEMALSCALMPLSASMPNSTPT